MKRMAVALSLLASVALAWGGSITDLDKKNGFRDVVFGEPLPDLDKFVVVEDSGDFKSLTRPGDKMALGASELTRLTYATWKGKLVTVSLGTEGVSDSNAMLAAFEAAYGEGRRKNRFSEKRGWLGSRVFASYDWNRFSKKGSLFLASIPMMDQMKADKEAAAQQAATDF